jgi:hypothetical protein
MPILIAQRDLAFADIPQKQFSRTSGCRPLGSLHRDLHISQILELCCLASVAA